MKPSSSRHDLFGPLFARGSVDVGDQAWLRAMIEVEVALARALERAGLAPAGSADAVARVEVRLESLAAGTAAAGNPVVPVVRLLAPAAPSVVHRGATSQDILDSALMLVSRHALLAIREDLSAAAEAAAVLARAHRATLMAGRTLLQQAVPVTFGLVAAGWLSGLASALVRLRGVRLEVQYGGAAGTLAGLGADGPRVLGLFASELGLDEPVLPWHTSRGHVISLGAALAETSAALGKIARDVTLLAQTEVGEVSEAFSGSSSTMPHKRNPVASVALLACTRRIPGLLATLVSCAEQEHQRAAGAWQAEWETVSDLLRLTGSAASWGRALLSDLRVDAERMRANMGDWLLAEQAAERLIPSLGRTAAHDLVASGRVPVDGSPDFGAYLGAADVFVDRALASYAEAAS